MACSLVPAAQYCSVARERVNIHRNATLIVKMAAGVIFKALPMWQCGCTVFIVAAINYDSWISCNKHS